MAALRTVFCKELFAGKVAIVTGGGTGIGKAISSELARLGCKVVIASRKMEALQETAKEINLEVAEMERGGADRMSSLPERVYPYQCNIRTEEQVGGFKNDFLAVLQLEASTKLPMPNMDRAMLRNNSSTLLIACSIVAGL